MWTFAVHSCTFGEISPVIFVWFVLFLLSLSFFAKVVVLRRQQRRIEPVLAFGG